MAYAEESNTDHIFAVAGTAWEPGRERENLLIVTHGTHDQVLADLSGHNYQGCFMINVSDIISRLRAKAHAQGVNLEGRFFLHPHDPKFREFIAQAQFDIDGRLAGVKADPKKRRLVHKV